MKSFIVILVGLLLSCSGVQQSRNSELTAEYYGVVEVRKGGAYIDEATLRQLAKQDNKTHYIVFSDDMCGGCTYLKEKLRERGWIDKVHFLNLDDKWVQELAGIMDIKALPTMVVQLKKEKGTLYFEGSAEIMMYLVRNL
jgi:thioredoxin-related protein